MKLALGLFVLWCAAAVGSSYLAKPKPLLVDPPAHQTAAPFQPAFRLFPICPVGRRDVPILPEQRA